jgi:hypothetical protein
MSYFVVLPGALVPASIAVRLLARANIPRLSRRLPRAKAESIQPAPGERAPHLAWLWRRFGGAGDAPVTAPYAWRSLNRASATDVASEQPLWHADLVHFAFARDHMLVASLEGEAAVTADESRQLAEVAGSIAAEFNATLRVIDATHWFLSFDPPWNIVTVGLDAALGRSVEQVLPDGEAAGRWRKLLNEIQMHWHQHPVNEHREAEGRPAINGLWLHGGGIWQALPQRPFDAVATDDATVRGWALAAGVAPNALLEPDRVTQADGRIVLVYDKALLHAAHHEDWDGWLEALAPMDALYDALCARAFANGHDMVTFVLAGRQHASSVVVRPGDRWAFWRRRTIADLFAEPETA